MNWQNVAHVPVENNKGHLVGLITYAELIKYYSTHPLEMQAKVSIKDIMIKDLITVTNETSTIDAINLMRKNNITCLPVVGEDDILVGIVTEHDFVNVADHFLQEYWSGKKDG